MQQWSWHEIIHLESTQILHVCVVMKIIGVIIKRCYENMQQIYRRAPMPKCQSCKTVVNL